MTITFDLNKYSEVAEVLSVIKAKYPDRPEQPPVKQVEQPVEKPSPEARFAELIKGLVVKQDLEKEPDSYFYCKGKEIFFEHDKKNKILWCDYLKVWRVFETEYSMKYVEIQALIKGLVEKHYNLREVLPHSFFLWWALRWRSITI